MENCERLNPTTVRRPLKMGDHENRPSSDQQMIGRLSTGYHNLSGKGPLSESDGGNKLKTLQDARRALSDRSNGHRHMLSLSKTGEITSKGPAESEAVVTAVVSDTEHPKDIPTVSTEPPRPLLPRRSDRPALRDITETILDHAEQEDTKSAAAAIAAAEKELDESLNLDLSDDKPRYQEKDEQSNIMSVPVVPIKVPEHLKPLLLAKARVMAKENATTTTTTPTDAISSVIKRKRDGEVEDDTEHEKKQKPVAPSTVQDCPVAVQPSSQDAIDTFFANASSHDSSVLCKKFAESAHSTVDTDAPRPRERIFQSLDSLPDIKELRKELLSDDVLAAARAFDKEQELRGVKARMLASNGLAAFDYNDPMMVPEYADDIFNNLHDAETSTLANPLYAANQQHEITWKTRGVLIDWVIEIHYRFQLLPETLFLAVNIIDRFLSRRTVALGKLQLVGITALFIAAKFEEIITPPIRTFLAVTNKHVKEDELLKAERFILQVLDFQLCYANPLNFFRRAALAEDYDVNTRMLAKYFMEISCVDHRFIGIRPSQISSASLWLAQKMVGRHEWHQRTVDITGYKTDDLKPTVELMLDFLSQPVKHEIFFQKWATRKLLKVSIFVRDWINRYYVA